MELKLVLDNINKDQEEKIKKTISEVILAIQSKRYLIHVARLVDEETNVYTEECSMINTISMKNLSLNEVMQLQQNVAMDIIKDKLNKK